MESPIERLEQTFLEVSLKLRQWDTWKLQCSERDVNGYSRNIWEGMSPGDQLYNVAWNELKKVCRTMSAHEVESVLEYAKRVK